MLNITSKGNYGLRAMLELAMHYNQGVLQVNDISKRRDIPKTYLEQLLNTLKKSGLVKSLRGNKGGYQLAKSPDEISLHHILHSLEGNGSAAESYGEEDAIKQCIQRAEETLQKEFDITLRELVANQKKLDEELTFYI